MFSLQNRLGALRSFAHLRQLQLCQVYADDALTRLLQQLTDLQVRISLTLSVAGLSALWLLQSVSQHNLCAQTHEAPHYCALTYLLVYQMLACCLVCHVPSRTA